MRSMQHLNMTLRLDCDNFGVWGAEWLNLSRADLCECAGGGLLQWRAEGRLLEHQGVAGVTSSYRLQFSSRAPKVQPGNVQDLLGGPSRPGHAGPLV